jgi:Peptidase C13 family
VFAAHVVPRNQTAKYATDHINTCLGDLYSVGWIELAEKYNLHHWSLQKEFERVRNRTSNHQTFKEVCFAPVLLHSA